MILLASAIGILRLLAFGRRIGIARFSDLLRFGTATHLLKGDSMALAFLNMRCGVCGTYIQLLNVLVDSNHLQIGVKKYLRK